ncbi:MAG TPA: DUF222 domain-containing protein [Actinomycetota bacterium]|nr:DUF222 domain-containing protein [Actinomycetota bacterium]
MFDEVKRARELLKGAVAALDPEVLDAGSAKELVAEFADIERVAAAGKALAARRVASSGAWRQDGDRSPAHWMARTTKTPVGAAAGLLETAARVKELPRTEQALRAGRLNEIQAKEVASAAAADPAAEDELLKAAETESAAGLKECCARVRAAALSDEVARYENVRNRRRLRHWSDPDGAFRLDALLTPDAGAAVLAALGPHRDEIAAAARKQGRRDPDEAYLADALVAVAEHARDCPEDPVCTGPKAMVHVRVDHSAFRRGECAPGETCEIPGVGPVPVATAAALAGDSIIASLITNGTDVTAVDHRRREIPARLRSAVIERDRCCVVPGCDVRHGLEIDHMVPVHETCKTRLDNLARLCRWHHYLKTYRGYRLTGPPGRWRWEPPARE